MAKSPQARTIAALEAEGYLVDITERRITSKIKKDLFGFIDVVALAPAGSVTWGGRVHETRKGGLLGVQITSGSNHAARRKKILNECRDAAIWWLNCRNRIQVRSWSKRVVRRGQPKRVWVERVEDITLEMFG